MLNPLLFGGRRVRDESGFTLVELMSVIMLVVILMALGATALRRYWFVQGLVGAENEVVSQLRAQQQQSRTTAPKVFGARFTVGSSEWDLISYNSEITTVGNRCEVVEERKLGAGVVVEAVNFDEVLDEPGEQAACLQGATALVLFYARGSATPGSVTLYQPDVDRSERVCVTGLTGRVESC